jgi:hypothetical protein
MDVARVTEKGLSRACKKDQCFLADERKKEKRRIDHSFATENLDLAFSMDQCNSEEA